MRDSVGGDEFGVPVYIIEKNATQQIRINLNEYKDHQYIDIRTFYCFDGEFKPSKKGVTLPPELYPELLQGIVILGEVLGMSADDET